MSSAISSADVLWSNILQTILTGFIVFASIIKVFHSAFEYLSTIQEMFFHKLVWIYSIISIQKCLIVMLYLNMCNRCNKQARFSNDRIRIKKRVSRCVRKFSGGVRF